MFLSTRIICTIGITTVIVTAAAAADWPQFHGADRTNKSRETGLLKSWPADGPKLLWTASGAGAGYSGVSVVGNAVYTAGSKNKANFVFAYNRATGQRLWERRIGEEWEATGSFSFARAYQGSRGTPAVDGGMVYYLSDNGTLAALDAKDGAVKWSVNLQKNYDAVIPDYGYSESPLIIGDRVYVGAFGKKAAIVSLDKRTGRVMWESAPVAGKGGFASIVPMEHGGIRQLVTFSSDLLFGVNMDNGAVLWTVPFRNRLGLNCTNIVFHGGDIFATSGYGLGAMLVRLNVSGGRVTPTKVYETKVMDNHHGGVILHNGYVYGASHDNGWHCLDFKTGREMWKTSGKGSITFADGMLYLYDEKGTMTLARAAHDKFTRVSSFQVPEGGRGAFWAHPVVVGGVLYLRHADKIFAYDIKQR